MNVNATLVLIVLVKQYSFKLNEIVYLKKYLVKAPEVELSF